MFIDIIRPDHTEEVVLDKYVIRALWLGMRGLLVECSPKYLKEFKKYRKQFNESCLATLREGNQPLSIQQEGLVKQKLQGFGLWPCLFIMDESDKRSIKPQLQTQRKSYPIIIVECSTAELTKWAIQDNRVDGIIFPPKIASRLFDMATARIIGKEKFLVIAIEDFVLKFNQRVQYARDLRKNLFLAKQKNNKIVYCSRASSVDMMRSPMEIQGLIAEIGDYPLDRLKTSGKTTLMETIRTNQFRNSSEYVGPGVEIIND